MKSILVTGSKGFIGSALVDKLKLDGYTTYEYSHLDGDIENENTWDNFEKADVVIHLAGKSFVPKSWENISDFFNTNIIGTTEALKYCKKNNSKLIFLSTYMYGNPKRLPISENDSIEVTNPYTLSKKLAEEVCYFYNKNFNINITILRPFNVFGPNQSINFIIPKIFSQIINNKSVNLIDLEPKRDFIFLYDLVNAIISSINSNDFFEIYNVGSGQSISIGNLAKKIIELTGNHYTINAENNKRQGEIIDCFADITKIKNNLGWEPKWTLEMGLKEILKQIK